MGTIAFVLRGGEAEERAPGDDPSPEDWDEAAAFLLDAAVVLLPGDQVSCMIGVIMGLDAACMLHCSIAKLLPSCTQSRYGMATSGLLP